MNADQGTSLRDRLVDAGVELVLTEGAGSVGLREIARRAGVSHGAPRRYFPTHRELLSAIAHRGFADLAGRYAAATAGVDGPRDQLAVLARVYVDYALQCRGMFELMFRHDLLDSTGRRPEPSERPRLRESTMPLFRTLVDLVERHQQAAGRDGPAGVVAAALWANVHGIAQLWAWHSMQLALTETTGERQLAELVDAALDAHLGPAR